MNVSQPLKGMNIWEKDVLLEMNFIRKNYGLMITTTTLLHVLKTLSCRDGSILLHVMKHYIENVESSKDHLQHMDEGSNSKTFGRVNSRGNYWDTSSQEYGSIRFPTHYLPSQTK